MFEYKLFLTNILDYASINCEDPQKNTVGFRGISVGAALSS